ncbi:MAG: ricin-type beta-trefoil lectin domain protein [bacterium]|nr:ricin-type beta-trefoil lectin domain protein [bacterium]
MMLSRRGGARLPLLVALTSLLAHLPAAYGQGVVPVGEEFRVNATSEGSQDSPSVAALTEGDLVVVWRSGPRLPPGSTEDPSGSINGQLFAADGTALGEELQVNTLLTGDLWSPAVTALTGGGFAVVWRSRRRGLQLSDIRGRLFTATGTAVGEEFQIVTSAATHTRPSLSGLADGGFVVAWTGLSSSGIRGRRYAADSTAVGEVFDVSNGFGFGASVAGLSDGGFVVVWQSSGASDVDRSGYGIQGQRYGADGTVSGGVFQVNTYRELSQQNPSVSGLADGGFVVVWETETCVHFFACGPLYIQGQRFAADGAFIGGELQVGTYHGPVSQSTASVSTLTDGGFVVFWHSSRSPVGIKGQRYAADGSTLGGALQLPTETDVQLLEGHSVSSMAGGSLTVVWESLAQGFDVHGRRFTAPDADAQRFALVGRDGRCLDVGSADPADGMVAALLPCTGDESQRWRLDLTPVPQRVIGPGGKCLLPGGAIASGGNVVIGECGGPADLWQLVTAGPSSPSSLNLAGTDLCLSVGGASTGDGTPAQLLECDGGADQIWRPAPEACSRDSRGLCLNRDRFRVDVDWRDYQGNTGSGRAVSAGSDESGLLWFFSADNWELLVKVLDGCALNDRFWVFAAGTTDVEYTLRVTDTAVGAIREYSNSLGTASPAITDADAFATCSVSSAIASPTADPVAPEELEPPISGVDEPSRSAVESKILCANGVDLCLNDARFRVEVEWSDFSGNTGVGRVVPIATRASGILNFFSGDNWEMLIKVLDGCAINDHYWVFAAATTDVEYTLRVTDVDSGKSREYFNPLGNASPAITDTLAFETCP